MKREYFSDSISRFLSMPDESILGILVANYDFKLETTQRDAWRGQINILKKSLSGYRGTIYFEYNIPRMGKRIDVVLLIGPIIFVIEFKVGETDFTAHGIDQVFDYALDLKNFHEPSHNSHVLPILVATEAVVAGALISTTPYSDKLFSPVLASANSLRQCIQSSIEFVGNEDVVNFTDWDKGRYLPTPTIVEAAMALYGGHSVLDISRNDAGVVNISQTSEEISRQIKHSKENNLKSICFVTGVPGAGKTLVGLNIATLNLDKKSDLYSVFLSGNGPLVAILREALTRDKVAREKSLGHKLKKGEVMSEVKTFIQNVHNFRDDCLVDTELAPPEHVVLFDEAQRAWGLQQTVNFMRRKKNIPNFSQSEPEFLISCLDRHRDWAMIVCLVGGGQEIHTGEAGISEWIDALNRSFPDWHVSISSRLLDSEYDTQRVMAGLASRSNVSYSDKLHLSVSLRSFRAEDVSLLVKQLLDLETDEATKTLRRISKKYPVVLTRNLAKAKEWLKSNARGTERYGLLVSSQAERLKPHAIDIKSPVDPVHWFLDKKEDVRSSFYLEDAATEFQVQGLELDWSCVVWDADFRYTRKGWVHKSFIGSRWNNIKNREEGLSKECIQSPADSRTPRNGYCHSAR